MRGIEMTMTNDGRRRGPTLLIAGLLALTTTQLLKNASADDEQSSSSRAVCLKMINEMADEIQKYCKGRNVRTLQYLQFLGAHGDMSNDALEDELIASLRKRGIQIQDLDNTRLKGRITSQSSGSKSVLLVQCTLVDANGAELQTFRLREVVSES